MNIHGIILLNKQSGVTSFDEIRYLKKHYGIKKIGHAGTLDKFADGVLIILLGSMTKFSQYFLSLEKEYHAQFFFGSQTDTLDPEGSVIGEAAVPEESELKSVLTSFHGEITQVPPKFSAVHVNGKRAYLEARSGKEPDMPERKVNIHSFALENWDPPVGEFSIRCSKGTYVRSLARDLAYAVSSRAYVQSLTRRAVGPFTLEHTISSNEFDASQHIISGYEAVSRAFPVEDAVAAPEYVKQIRNGVIPQESWYIRYSRTDDDSCFLHVADPDGHSLAWYRRTGSVILPIHVQPGA